MDYELKLPRYPEPPSPAKKCSPKALPVIASDFSEAISPSPSPEAASHRMLAEASNVLVAARRLLEASRHITTIHQDFLLARQEALQQMFQLARQTISTSLDQLLGQANVERPAMFGLESLKEFASSSVVKCFGSRFQALLGRRIPRIPNGDLLMISRVISITGADLGCLADTQGSSEVNPIGNRPVSILAEVDAAPDAWYFQDTPNLEMPYSVLLEIALQPCGFLSAYLGALLLFGEQDFYFRNLDGKAEVLNTLDVRGQTLTTQARLLSTTVAGEIASGRTLIQKFEFETSCQGLPLLRGESVFGFFDQATMARQVGLPALQPASHAGGNAQRVSNHLKEQEEPHPVNPVAYLPGQPGGRAHRGHLDLLDEIFVASQGGNHGLGRVSASRMIRPSDWFFACHFFEDPVMPGSLGIEAILQAMQAFALDQDLGKDFRSPHFSSWVPGAQVTWKYRGQITPHNTRQMILEAHILQVDRTPDLVTLRADASLWADATRIYEIKNLAIGIKD